MSADRHRPPGSPRPSGPLAEAPEPHALASSEILAEETAAQGAQRDGGVDDSDASVMRTGGSIAVATLVSRITGFVRTVLVLAMLGGALSSAFQAAYVLPNMIAEVVLGAVLTAIVIPVLVRAEMEDSDGGAGFINRIFTLTVVILGAATVIAVIAAPLLTFLNVGDGKVDRQLTTALAYLLLPAILFYGLSALFMAILNMKNVFKPGAWAPVLNNVVQIATLVLFYVMPGELTLNPVKMSDPKLLVLGVGTTIGVVIQAGILLPYLKRAGIKLRLQWGIDDRLRRFGGMAVAIVAYVLILQVGMVITYRIAASATDSGISVYATHWQLLQLPYGVLGVTILTAIMPRLSRNAAADDTDAVIDDMSLATRLTMLALVPTVVYMTFFGPALGVAVFNFGRFDQGQAAQLGSVLAWGAFTLIPYAMTLVQLRVFYAREDAWTPTLMVLGITVVKVAASFLGPVLFSDPELVVRWLALSNGLGYLVGALVGHYLLYRRLGDAKMRHLARTTTLTIVVSLAVTAAVWGIARLTRFSAMATQAGKIGSVAYLAITGIVVLGVIYLLLVALRIPDMVTISNAVMRLVGRFIPALAPTPSSSDADDQRDATTMTVQFPRINPDEALPYSGQVEVRRRFDRGSASWQEYAVTSGGAAGETTVIPRIGADPRPLPSQMVTRTDLPKPPATPGRGRPPMTDTSPAQPRGPRLVAGAAIAGGRYRLLEPHGGTRGLQFWQAHDGQLNREVGLTFVDPDQLAPPYRPEDRDTAPDGPQAILNRTRRLGQLHTAGVARVLDVIRGASGGIVVTEWIPGTSLADAAQANPSATGAARAVRTLAAGAEAAHRAGAALSIDHPDRIRVSIDGDAVLAFPAVLSGDDRASDVRGLGAVLYALLLDRWPLDAETGRTVITTAQRTDPIGGLAIADPDTRGSDPDRPVPPVRVHSEIPFEISAVATRALEGGGGIRTAGTVQHILDQATVVDLATDVIPRVADDRTPVSVAPLSRTRKERLLGEGEAGKRNGALLIGAGLFVLFVIVALVLWLTNAFSGDDPNDLDAFLPDNTSSAPASPGKSVPVTPLGVTVFDPEGEPDTTAAANVGNVLTGAAPAWKTSQYRGLAAYGGLKDGIGLMFRLPEGASVSQIQVRTPTPGFAVDIRTANRAKPALNSTSVVGSGKVDKTTTTLTLDAPAKSGYLLIWITALPENDDGLYQAIIKQISFTRS
ncbi:murein biosynthesis integral membrane protein MurJ [Gordonia alkaliphila]|uniref:murein biosynthesis integral membrane protein MurJ n=1 Tax=Gordonia alkaliphila TaxID=1053547 RepID=UPI001FF648A4|nr:murein biosynthesis integral membrane protein MurJ [Gordonia alkaliphila]MCK0439011.1 murein biosynthesis integral membrane protein MurJ [Gordonia alkaliphila]